jgi:DNA-binding protein H-NS
MLLDLPVVLLRTDSLHGAFSRRPADVEMSIGHHDHPGIDRLVLYDCALLCGMVLHDVELICAGSDGRYCGKIIGPPALFGELPWPLLFAFGLEQSRKATQEQPVRKSSYAEMSLDALLDAKEAIERVLSERADQLRQQIARLTGSSDKLGRKRANSSLKGKKVAPKYRGPNGELWAGRGAQPAWLREQFKKGRRLDSFLIDRQGKKAASKKATKKTKRPYIRSVKESKSVAANQGPAAQ